jgi:hypothetical protein
VTRRPTETVCCARVMIATKWYAADDSTNVSNDKGVWFVRSWLFSSVRTLLAVAKIGHSEASSRDATSTNASVSSLKQQTTSLDMSEEACSLIYLVGLDSG